MSVETSRVSSPRMASRVARSLSWRRLLVFLAILAATAAAGYAGYQRVAPAPPPRPTVVPVRTGSIAATVSATGTLISTRQARLTFPTSGRLAEFAVSLGERVKAGQVLGRLDATQLDNRLAQAQSSQRISQIRLDQLKAGSTADDIAAAQAAYNSAVTRLSELRKGSTAVELQSAQATVDSAAASLRSANARLDQLQSGATDSDIRAAEQSVASAQTALVKAQNDYDRLSRGADPNDVLAAERSLQQAQNSLWSAQIDRDATCGRGPGTGCDSANARVANSETSVAQAADKLAQVKAGPKPEDVAAAQKALDGAKVGLAAAQARLEQVKSGPTAADLQAAKSSVESAQASYDSALARLNDLKAGPKLPDILAAEAQVASALATLNLRKGGPTTYEIAIAEEQLKQAVVAVKLAELDLANATIVAPFDGVVAAIQGNVGEMAASNTTFVTIVDPTALRVDVAVDENDVGKLRAGQLVNVTFESRSDQRLAGRISAVSPLGVSQQGVVTYPVAITLGQVPEGLQAGITANASIVIAQREGVLLVPNRAIRTSGRSRSVTVLGGGKTEDRVVQVGLSNDQLSEVTAGLNDGEQVVIPTTTTRAPNLGGPGFGPGFGAPAPPPQAVPKVIVQ